MKLSTNFSWRIESSLLKVAILFIVVSTISIVGSLILTSLVVNINDEIKNETQSANKLRTILEIDGKTLSQSRIVSLSDRIKYLSSLSQVKGLSLGWILSTLESKLPNHVHLNKFTFDGIQGITTLQIESTDLEEITLFVESLDNTQHFENVEILQQLRTGNGNAPIYKYDIKLTE
jgi:hypothetical protein